MDAAEAGSRAHRKPGKDVDRLVRAARLRQLEINLGTKIKRHKDPGNVSNVNPFAQAGSEKEKHKDVSEVIMSGF